MSTLPQDVHALVDLLSQGRTLDVIERYYAEDACVFENRMLARGGRDACLAYEREELSKLQAGPALKVHAFACNEADGTAFIECTVRFTGADGRPMRLEEVIVQQWSRGKIQSERFYYEGVVDEGDEEPQT